VIVTVVTSPTVAVDTMSLIVSGSLIVYSAGQAMSVSQVVRLHFGFL